MHEQIDLVKFYENYYVIEIKEFEKSELRFLQTSLEREEITQEEVDQRKKQIKELVEFADKHNHEVIIQTPTGTEWSDVRYKMYEHDNVWTYQIGVADCEEL